MENPTQNQTQAPPFLAGEGSRQTIGQAQTSVPPFLAQEGSRQTIRQVG